jgi:rRNA maturation endonuclease Nob1
MTWFLHPIKKCKRCGKNFDQGTNKDICKQCRSNGIKYPPRSGR